MITIVPFKRQHLAALVAVANEHLALVPPTDARITAEALATILTAYETLWLDHYPEDAEIPVQYRTLVALDDGSPIGLIMVRWEPEDLSGHIPFFLAARGYTEAARRLLAAAEVALRDERMASVEAGDRCPVGLGWFGLPVTWEHIIAAYEAAGYRPEDHWVIMTGRADAIPIEPPRPAGKMPHILLTEHHERREWLIDLYHDDQIIGECHAWGVPPHLEPCPGFRDWVTIEWIGVEEPFQRRGLAFWLMVKQMHYQLRAGRTQVMLWTGPDNTPARSLYFRLGFVDGPETRVYRKELT